MKHADFGRRNGVKGGSGGGQARVKRVARQGAALAALIVLAACSSPEDIADEAGIAAPATPAATTAAPAPAPGKVAFADNAANGEAKREFAYEWPAEVSAIPMLAARLAADRDTLLADQKTEWDAAVREFGASDCVACVNRDFQKSWEVVADGPRFLSLSYSFYAYIGGAHGNSASGGLVWDRESGTALEAEDFFTSAKAMQDVLGPRWCKALATARRAKLGADAPADDGIFPCPPIADLTVLLGSHGKAGFDRIGLIADPYVAGSYAEGQYEVTIPVSKDVLAVVRPEYKAAFALAK